MSQNVRERARGYAEVFEQNANNNLHMHTACGGRAMVFEVSNLASVTGTFAFRVCRRVGWVRRVSGTSPVSPREDNYAEGTHRRVFGQCRLACLAVGRSKSPDVLLVRQLRVWLSGAVLTGRVGRDQHISEL